MLSQDGKKYITILAVLMVVTTVPCFLRWIPRRRKNVLSTDDYLLVFALLMLYIQYVGGFLLATKGGMGFPITTLSQDQIEWLFKMFFWPALGYSILISTIKLSVLFSYRRIFARIRWFRIAVHVLMALVAGWFLSVFFGVLFQCTPVDKAWKPLKPGTCIDYLPFLWGNSISNNILDYLILLLPVVPVCQLQVSKTQRGLLLGAFALGSLACIAGTIRAVTTGTLDVNDFAKSSFQASIWTHIEPSMGIMGACLPFLAQMFRQRMFEMFGIFSTFGSKARSLLGISHRKTTGAGVGDTGDDAKRSGRATPGQYDMFDDIKDEEGMAGVQEAGVTVRVDSLRTFV